LLRRLPALLLALLPAPALAHPHVLIDAASEIVFDAEGRVAAVRHHWRFDEAFSAMASQGLDTDDDGKLYRAELEPLAKVNVESLAEYDFFTFLAKEGTDQAFEQPTDYWLDANAEGTLTLHFTLPLKAPVAPDRPLTLEVYDPEYFIAFRLPSKEAVRLAGAPASCALDVVPARDLGEDALAALAQIGPDQRELPEDLKALTEGTDNKATFTCAG